MEASAEHRAKVSCGLEGDAGQGGSAHPAIRNQGAGPSWRASLRGGASTPAELREEVSRCWPCVSDSEGKQLGFEFVVVI